MQTLEERVKILEEQMAYLVQERSEGGELPAWWDKWFGAFKDDPSFDRVVQAGEEYRRTQQEPIDVSAETSNPC